MYQAWAQFKQMLTPYHLHTNAVLAHAFFKGLKYDAHVFLNNTDGG